jgi:flagellar basal-body rod modification protein FlgD
METVSAIGNSATGTASSSNFTSRLNQTDFLKLLVTQMQNQDPLNPQDPNEFTTQLTQFSQLEQLLNIKTALEDVKTSQTSLEHAQATDYIGKTVRAGGAGIQISGGQPTPITYDLASNAATVSIQVRDSAGQLVRTVEQSLVKGGTQSLTFDGKDTLGQPLPDGEYSLTITALDNAGQAVEAVPFRTGVVTGVNLESEEPTLLVGGQPVKLSEILEISTLPSA